jgi:hypothetical protein
MVAEVGLEPTRSFEHWNLNPARLPISPFGHTRKRVRLQSRLLFYNKYMNPNGNLPDPKSGNGNGTERLARVPAQKRRRRTSETVTVATGNGDKTVTVNLIKGGGRTRGCHPKLQTRKTRRGPVWWFEWTAYEVDSSGKDRKKHCSRVIGLKEDISEAQARAAMREVMRVEAERQAAWNARKVRQAANAERRGSLHRPVVNGLMGELTVCLDLTRHSIEVFRPLNPFSSCDLLAITSQGIKRVEVKYAAVVGGRHGADLTRNMGRFDLLAVVDIAGRVHYFKSNGVDPANIAEYSLPRVA